MDVGTFRTEFAIALRYVPLALAQRTPIVSCEVGRQARPLHYVLYDKKASIMTEECSESKVECERPDG